MGVHDLLGWLTKYEAVAVWLEGVALLAILIPDVCIAHSDREDTREQLKLTQDQIKITQNVAGGHALIAKNAVGWCTLASSENIKRVRSLRAGIPLWQELTPPQVSMNICASG